MVDVPAGDMLPVAEVAELLGLTKPRVHAFIRSGRLPAVRVGIQFLVSRDDAMAFKAIPRKPGRQPKAAKPPAAKRRKKR